MAHGSFPLGSQSYCSTSRTAPAPIKCLRLSRRLGMVALGGARGVPAANAKNYRCVFLALEGSIPPPFMLKTVMANGEAVFMKKLVLATAAVLALLSVAANAQGWNAPMGKGKAPPPPPVVTKG